MDKNCSEKYNDAALKMFEFLEELYRDDVDFKWAINHFSDGAYKGKSNTHVTINKYLNALNIFGVKVEKNNGKYCLRSPLYKIDFKFNDVKCVNILKKACQALPNCKKKLNCEEFIKELEKRYDEETKNLSKIENSSDNVPLTFFNPEMLEQVKQCEKYCQDNFKLEIIYNNDKGKEINLVGSPLETIYKRRKVFLKVCGNNGNRVYEIPLDNIKYLKQLHSSTNGNSMPATVVYRIKNRLAKNYRLRDWEKLENIEADGSHIIVNKDEDFDMFLSRLMRYGRDCEIISPKYIKEEMIERINKTLENYQ